MAYPSTENFTAGSPASGEILGHPPQLFLLVLVKTCDSFGFLGLKSLLVLYLVRRIGSEDGAALTLLGSFLALSFLSPVLGGALADRLGAYRMVSLVGALLTSIGNVTLAVMSVTDPPGGVSARLLGPLAAVAVGNGFLKSGVMSLVGAVYRDGDPRKDSGFSIGYFGMNMGGFAAALSCAYVAARAGWTSAFVLTATGAVSSLAALAAGWRSIAELPESHARHTVVAQFGMVASVAVLVTLAAAWLLGQPPVLAWSLGLAACAAVARILILLIENGRPGDLTRFVGVCALSSCAIIMWVIVEQAAGSLTLLADRWVPRAVLGIDVPAAAYQSLAPIFILIMSPLLALLWWWLPFRGRKNPSARVKFVLGFVTLAAALLPLIVSIWARPSGQIPAGSLVCAYALLALGELLISPIGLAFVTDSGIPSVRGTMMGLWFLSLACGDLLAHAMGKVVALEGLAGGSPSAYSRLFTTLALMALLMAALLASTGALIRGQRSFAPHV